MTRPGCCSCCKRHVETKGHTEKCRLKGRPVPCREFVTQQGVYEVTLTPIHTRGDDLLAEHFERMAWEAA